MGLRQNGSFCDFGLISAEWAGLYWRSGRTVTPMSDARIEAFLADVLALEGENPDAIREGVHVAVADCEQIFHVRQSALRPRVLQLKRNRL
jgi:hypothetical protein